MSKVDNNRKKTGGRGKGTPNKLTEDARKVFLETLEGEVPNIQEAFSKVLNGEIDEEGNVIHKPNPEKYLDLFAKYAQYFVPKKTENDVKTEVSGSFDFNQVVDRLRGDQ